MATCQIKWIDSAGNPTPDSNPAIYRVRTKSRVEQHHGRALQFGESQWFNCCAEHFKRMSDPGMEIWDCEVLLPSYPINDLYAAERAAHVKLDKSGKVRTFILADCVEV